MKLVLIAAVIAVCSAAKLDRTYLPPPSAASAGGSHDSLQTPLIKSSNQGPELPTTPLGSYNNNFDGVVVDAAAPGTRAAAEQLTGLGGSRPSYGSTDSKVGDAAFRGSAGFNGPALQNVEQNFAPEIKPQRAQAFNDRNSNILTYSNEVNPESYSYGFETDNGISVGENGIAVNGVQAEGGYSYKGDDGQVYKVTYVADDKGYRPVGAHLPTPPPIPEEILKSLEQNAKEEAAGLVDDGSYDAQKYNAEGDYAQDNSGGAQHNGALSQFGSQSESDAITSGTFVNQNSQAFGNPGSDAQTQNDQGHLNGLQSQSGFGIQGHQGNQHGQSGNQFAKPGPQGLQGQNTISGNQFGKPASLNQQANGFPTSQFSNQVSQTHSFAQTGQQSAHGNGLHASPSHNFQNSQLNQQPTSQFGNFDANLNNGQNQGSASNGFASSQFGHQPDQHHNVPHNGQHIQQATGFSQSGFSGNFQQQSSQFGFQASQNKPSVGQTFDDFGSAQASAQTSDLQSFAQTPESNGNNFQQQPTGTNAFSGNKQSNFGSSTTFGASSSSSTGNRFSQSNRFQPPNEYLPPLSQQSPISANQGLNNAQIPNGQTPNFNGKPDFPGFSSASAATGASPLRQPVNTIPTNLNNYNQAPQGQVQANRAPFSAVGQNFVAASKPTVVPQTVLTTPLEPSEESTSLNAQSASSFGSQPINGFMQSNSQLNSNKQPSSQSTAFPSSQSQFGNNFASKPEANVRPQPQQAGFGPQQNVRPSFSQGPDDSYYYNQPSKPFNTPVLKPQVPKFPETSQSTSFGGQNSGFAAFSPATQLGQLQGSSNNNGITQAAISSFPSVQPTPSQLGVSPNQFGDKPSFNQQSFGQKQSSAGPFTQSKPFPSRPISQYGQKPSASQSQPQQPQQPQQSIPENQNVLNSQPSNEPVVQNEQYQGTIYEYNKPPQTLPAPSQSDSDSSQTIQSAIASSQGNQVAGNADASKPHSVPQGSSPGFASFNQNAQQFNKPTGSRPNQFNRPSHGSTVQVPQNNQFIQNNGVSKPFGSNEEGYPNAGDSRPQSGLQYPQTQFNQNAPNFGSRQPANQPTGLMNNKDQGPFSQNQPQNLDQSPQTSIPQSSAAAVAQSNGFPSQERPSNAVSTNNFNSATSQANSQLSSNKPSEPFGNSQSQSPIPSNQPKPTKPLFNSACCQNKKPSQFGSQFSGFQGNAQGVAKEDFSGPKQPPSFDDNGYHY